MTVLIAARCRGVTFLAADTLISGDGFKDHQTKVGPLGPGIYGAFGGEMRAIPYYLEHLRLKPPRAPLTTWVRRTLPAALRRVAAGYGHVPESPKEVLPVEGLLVVHGTIVQFEDDANCWLPTRSYATSGVGCAFAAGALEVTFPSVAWLGGETVRAVLRRAVAAAAEWDPSCGGEPTIVECHH